jgi:hypothetical protein
MPMASDTLEEIMRVLDLPRCFVHDFASRKGIPLRMKRNSLQQSIGEAK